MKRYHLTTFGCQMNEHDSERIKGMLEALGYGEADAQEHADLILFNTCSIREAADSRFTAHLGHAKRLKREDPERVIGVGGCWAQSIKEEVFAQFPFVDVAFGPGQVHKLAEFLTSDSLTAQGFFEFEGFTGHLPAKRGREFQGWVQISVGCNVKAPGAQASGSSRSRGRGQARVVRRRHQVEALDRTAFCRTSPPSDRHTRGHRVGAPRRPPATGSRDSGSPSSSPTSRTCPASWGS